MIFNLLAPAFFCFLVSSALGSRAARRAGVGLAFLIGGNGLMADNARSSPRWEAGDAPEHRPLAVNCVFLGNSLVEAGCDVPVFISAWPKRAGAIVPLNLALGATTPEEHGMIFKRALELPVKLKYLIYGFVDDQLNEPTRGDRSELEADESPFSPSKAVALYAPRSPLKWRQAVVTGRGPQLTMRSSLWDEVALLRCSLDENAQSEDTDAFNRRCEAIMAIKSGFSEPISGMIQLARMHGATVILVEMPMPARHRQVYHGSSAWRRLHTYVQSLAWEEGAVFVTASDWVKDEGHFLDAVHLNEEGARLFSARLAATLSRLEAAAADSIEVVSR